MLKSRVELAKLDENSEEIFKRGTIDRYAERPSELENLCLADFVSQFTFKGKGISNTEETSNDHVIDEVDDGTSDDEEEHVEQKKIFKVPDGTLSRRKKPKVIRYCR